VYCLLSLLNWSLRYHVHLLHTRGRSRLKVPPERRAREHLCSQDCGEGNSLGLALTFLDSLMSPQSRRLYASMWETASWPKHQMGMPSQVNVGVISQAILLKFNKMAYEMPNFKLLPKSKFCTNSLNARCMPSATAAAVSVFGFGVWVWGLGYDATGVTAAETQTIFWYGLGFRPFSCRDACAHRTRPAAEMISDDAGGDPEQLYISIIRRPTGPRTRWHLTRLSSIMAP